jgi:hypothetical protein
MPAPNAADRIPETQVLRIGNLSSLRFPAGSAPAVGSPPRLSAKVSNLSQMLLLPTHSPLFKILSPIFSGANC